MGRRTRLALIAQLTVGMFVGFGTVAHADLIVDNFDTPNDYTTNLGVWSGTTATTAVASDGVLTITTSSTFAPSGPYFDGLVFYPGYLYVEVPGTMDFSVTVEMVSFGDSTQDSYPEIELLVADTSDTRLVYLFGAAAGWTGWKVRTEGGYNQNMLWGHGKVGWRRITRIAGEYTAWYSDDGTTWTQFGTPYTPPEQIAEEVVRVGIGYAVYAGIGGQAVFDNFSLEVIPEPASAVLVFLGFGAAVASSRVRRKLRVGS